MKACFCVADAQALDLRVCAGGAPQRVDYSLGLVIGGTHSLLIGQAQAATCASAWLADLLDVHIIIAGS